MTNHLRLRMVRVLLICALTIVGSTAVHGQLKPVSAGLSSVNGLKMYYEVYGEGKPLVLLHGAFMTINLNWSSLIPALAKNHKVIAVEFQGHGHTADINRDFSFESLADDVAGLLKNLGIEKADIIGYSLGGGVGTQLAIRYPLLVNKLVLLSCPFKSDGWTAESRKLFAIMKPEFITASPLKTYYDSVAPDKSQWTGMVTKVIKLVQTPYDFTSKIKSITALVLLVVGDADGIDPDHLAEMIKLLGGGKNGDMTGIPKNRFAMLPGTSHTGVIMKEEWLVSMILPFLDK